MTNRRRSILAIAAATGRVGYVYLIEGELKDWKMSRKGAQTTKEAAIMARSWITFLEPDMLVTEVTDRRSRKGKHSKAVVRAMIRVAKSKDIPVIKLPKVKTHKNKFIAAQVLSETFPQIAARLPEQPKIWMPEPRDVTMFEALGLALDAMEIDRATKSNS